MTTPDQVVAGSEHERREEVRSRLLGTWELVSYTATATSSAAPTVPS